jgi:hypothetical protein
LNPGALPPPAFRRIAFLGTPKRSATKILRGNDLFFRAQIKLSIGPDGVKICQDEVFLAASASEASILSMPSPRAPLTVKSKNARLGELL